jgi:hypothetical protein
VNLELTGAQGPTGPTGPTGPPGADGSGGGGGGITSIETSSQAFAAIVDEKEGIATIGPKGLTTDVRVTDGRSIITLSFLDGILVNVR